MIKKVMTLLFFLTCAKDTCSHPINAMNQKDHVYIRTYDLGFTGLKTALLRYDKNTNKMEWIESLSNLGMCPDEREISPWIRSRMRELLNTDLDEEIQSGYFFGFSLAGLNKLRAKPLPTTDMSVLFELPSNKVRCIDDGSAHLVASLNSQNLKLPQGPIWNLGIGSGVSFGLTDNDHQLRNFFDLWSFFDTAPSPWDIQEPHTQEEMWRACGSLHGFNKIVENHNNIVDDEVFLEFAYRWKAYIETCILEYSTITFPEKKGETPAAIVFTGGHIDIYGDRLVDTLNKLGIKIPVFTGPKHAGLLGAAWNVITKPCGTTFLIKALNNQDKEKVEFLISKKASVNEKDALGNSPLITAVKTGNLELVTLLVRHGATIKEPDYAWNAHLFLAQQLGFETIAEFLLNHGA